MTFYNMNRQLSGGMPLCVREKLIARFSEVLREKRDVLHDADGNPIKITPSSERVFECLFKKFHNTKTGQCNPRHETIAALTGYSTRTVSRAVGILKRIGLLKIRMRYKLVIIKGKSYKVRTSNQYYIVAGVMRGMTALINNIDAVSLHLHNKIVETAKKITAPFKKITLRYNPTDAEIADMTAELKQSNLFNPPPTASDADRNAMFKKMRDAMMRNNGGRV